MRVLLVDPYYLNGNSPPSWVLGQLEAALASDEYHVEVVDFCHPALETASLAQFAQAEAQFVADVSDAAGRVDLVYVTTSFGIPQKPTPILGRVDRVLAGIAEGAPDVPVAVGGAQVEYLLGAGLDPETITPQPQIRLLAPDDQAVLGYATGLANGAAVQTATRVWTRAGHGAPFVQGSGAPPVSRLPVDARWDGWDLSCYPVYRAALTSLGCIYRCSFCFESRQAFQRFDFLGALSGLCAQGVSRIAVEDSTIFGAHRSPPVYTLAPELPDGLEYSCYALVAEIVRAQPEHLSALAAGGLRTVILGIESPDSETLRRYRKHVRPDLARRAIDKLHDARMSAQGCFMVGIPEVSLDDTLYTLDYALQLPLDVRRWHVFQPSFDPPPDGIMTPAPFDVRRFARIDVNLPDHLLPHLLESACPEHLLDEHTLIRALPFLDPIPDPAHEIRYAAGYTLADLIRRCSEVLLPTKDSFNEEDYYRVLTPEHPAAVAGVDRGSALMTELMSGTA